MEAAATQRGRCTTATLLRQLGTIIISIMVVVQSGVINQEIQLEHLHDQSVARRGPVCKCCSCQKSSITTRDLSLQREMLSNPVYAKVRELNLAEAWNRKLTPLSGQTSLLNA